MTAVTHLPRWPFSRELFADFMTLSERDRQFVQLCIKQAVANPLWPEKPAEAPPPPPLAQVYLFPRTSAKRHGARAPKTLHPEQLTAGHPTQVSHAPS